MNALCDVSACDRYIAAIQRRYICMQWIYVFVFVCGQYVLMNIFNDEISDNQAGLKNLNNNLVASKRKK